MNIDEFRERLQKHLAARGESQNAIAKRLGQSQASLSRFTRGEQSLSLEAALVFLEDMGAQIIFPGQSYAPAGEEIKGRIREMEKQIEILNGIIGEREKALGDAEMLLQKKTIEINIAKDKLIAALEEISALKDRLPRLVVEDKNNNLS